MTENEIVETEVVDESLDAVDETEEKDARWSYFAVKEIAKEFGSKIDVKKWLTENGVENHTIIRGRVLPTGEKVVRKITIG
jgi:hypothetical protein